jgi:hypothetical protein
VKQVRAFVRLSRRDQGLLLKVLVALAICHFRLRTLNIKRLQDWATRAGNGTTPIGRLVWAVEAASRRIPGASCLCRALTLQRLLAKNGHESELRIGVAKSDNRFGAHAWLLHNGQVLIGDSQLGNYELLSAWRAKTDLIESKQRHAARR